MSFIILYQSIIRYIFATIQLNAIHKTLIIKILKNNFIFCIGNIVDPEKGATYSSIALGGVSLANAIFFMIFVFCMGISMAMSPLISQANARNKSRRIQEVLSNGSFLNLSVAILFFMVTLPMYSLLGNVIRDEQVYQVAKEYLFINMISLLPMMIFQTYKQFSEGMYYTKGITYATLLANLLNIALNYVLINGNLGFPRLGVAGSAIATLIARIAMIFFLIYFLNHHPTTEQYIKNFSIFRLKKNLKLQKKMLSLGFPIAFQLVFEVGAFSAAAFICEQYGTKDLAGHYIAIQVAAMTFLLCTGISVAATVRVGNYKGLHDWTGIRQAGFSNLFLVVIFMLFCGGIFILFRGWIPTLFTQDKEVILLTSGLFIVASLFQLFDGIQVVCLGILRGLQEVKLPTFITFFSYWVVAIPLGYYLTLEKNMGAIGMWIALGIGLFIASILLLTRFVYLLKSHNSP